MAPATADRSNVSMTVSPLPTDEPVPDRRDVADLVTLGSFAIQAPVAAVGLRRADGTWDTVAYGCQGGGGSVLAPLYDRVAASEYPMELPDLALLPIGGSLDVIRWGYGVALRNPDGTVAAVVAVFDRWKREIGRPEQGVLRLLSRRLLDLLRTSPAPAAPPAPRPVAPVSPATPSTLPPLMKTRDVASLFNVTDRTVLNWAERGHLPSVRTAGGHLRFYGPDVQELLNATA
jgi:excisionase family DNA binding protein